MQYKLLIFDLDGTLVDTAPDICACANAVFRQEGLPDRTDAEITKAIGRGVRDLMTKLLPPEHRTGPVFDRAVESFRSRYAAELTLRSAPYPGVIEMLGGPLEPFAKAVITNKPEPLPQTMLERLGMSPFFKVVVGTGGEFPAKPDPASVRFAMQKAGAGPRETLFIGDSSIDLETCRAAGIDFAWVRYGYEQLPEFSGRVFSNAWEWRSIRNGNFRG